MGDVNFNISPAVILPGSASKPTMPSIKAAPRASRLLAAIMMFVLLAVADCTAQSPGWLRYGIPPDPPRYHDLPHAVVVLGHAPEEVTATDELDRGVGHMLGGTDIVLHRFDSRVDSIVLGTADAVRRAGLHRLPGWTDERLPEEGYRILHLRNGIRQWYVLEGGSPRAELWAAFRFNALIGEDQQLPQSLVEVPQVGMRGLQIRGEAGGLSAINATAGSLLRMMASVNLNTLVLDGHAGEIDRLAAQARAFGVHVWLCANALDAQDTDQLKRLAIALPNVEAVVLAVPPDSTLEHLRSVLISTNSVAKALRGKGREVMLQDALGEPLLGAQGQGLPSIQERASLLQTVGLEPDVLVSEAAASALLPLAGLGSGSFGLMPGRAQAAHFELFGAPVDSMAYPAQVWQRALHTPERQAQGQGVLLDTLRSGDSRGGMIATVSADLLQVMMAEPMLQANLYAFGRLAWNPETSAASVAEDWSRLTWGDDARVYAVTTQILLGSAELFRQNSSPLGLASFTDGDPSARALITHGTEGSLLDGKDWGTDRTASGTNEARVYPDAFAAELASENRCPEAWLLAFHRLPYLHRLHDGKTSVQDYYDAYFASAAQIANAVDAWDAVDGLVDDARFKAVHAFLANAALQAEIRRDTATERVQRVSGVRDELGYVGHHPGRTEAEGMERDGWLVQAADAPEGASGEAYLRCAKATCSAATIFDGEENVYRIEVGYLDSPAVTFSLMVNGISRASWTNNASAGVRGGSNGRARRFIVNGIRLKHGDRVEVAARCEASQTAYLDFIEVTRDPRWN